MMRSTLTLETELREVLGTGRDALIAARHYGFDGRGGESLQTVGDAVGLTRERVRQIVTETSERLRIGPRVLRALDRTIAFVAGRMPAAAGLVEAEMRSEGLTSGLFRLEGVINAAELLGRRLPFSITKAKRGDRLVHAPNSRSVDTIAHIARRVAAHWGMATLSDVAAKVRKVESGECDRNIVARVLACQRAFHLLDQSAGWFWLSDNPRNPVLLRIRKILSVTNPICVSQLRDGITRDYRMGQFSPPQNALLEFCRQAPGLQVDNNTIRADPRINSGDVLTQTERDVIHMLSDHGGTMAASKFKSVCRGRGVNQTTYYLCLVNSPIIATPVLGRYGLIGSGENLGDSAIQTESEMRV
jgi:hypothetical protein